MAKLLPAEYYQIENRAYLTEQQARAEYARIRHDIVRRRVEAMAAKGLTETSAYKRGQLILNRPAGQLSGDELRAMLVEAGQFALGETAARQVQAARQKARARAEKGADQAARTLQQHGYNVKRAEMKQFGAYMQTWRNIPELAGWDSGRVARLYDKLKKMGGFRKDGNLKQSILKHFDEWINREPRLDDFMSSKGFESGKGLEAAYRSWEKREFGHAGPSDEEDE